MNIKLITLFIILSLSLILGFEKTSYGLNTERQDDISELKILNYLPKDNKTIFISNTKSSEISNDIRKNYENKYEDELVLIKNTILAYLGIDLGTNKLEDIYNDELTITTYDNKEKAKDDILLIFKIKGEKNLDDVLNLTNKIDEPDKLIKIFRENKLNYLKYIYRTNDNYILTSSNKNLIINALQISSIRKNLGEKYLPLKEVLKNFKNKHNILLSQNLNKNELLKYGDYSPTKEDYLITIFDLKDKKTILKSYLVNNNKSLDIMSYKKIDNENILDKKNYQISIYNDALNFKNYLNNIKINSFEKAFFKELNEKLKQNMLFFITNKNWMIIFDKNILSIENIKLLKDFNKNRLENNNKIYTIYSKDILTKEADIIKQKNYEKIFSIQTDNLILISNSLINDEDINLLSKGFFNFTGDSHPKYFLNKKIILKSPYFIQSQNTAFLNKINYLFKNIINLSIIEFKEIIKQSIPETTPLYYSETNLKIFNN